MGSVNNLSPGLLSMVGLLSLNADNVDWNMRLAAWLDQRTIRAEGEILRKLCSHYLETILKHITERTKQSVHRLDAPPLKVKTQNRKKTIPTLSTLPNYERYIDQSTDNMIVTLMMLLEVSFSS